MIIFEVPTVYDGQWVRSTAKKYQKALDCETTRIKGRQVYQGKQFPFELVKCMIIQHARRSGKTMTGSHFILTPTQLVGSGRPQRGSNPGPPYHKSRALPTEHPPPPQKNKTKQTKIQQQACAHKFHNEIEPLGLLNTTV